MSRTDENGIELEHLLHYLLSGIRANEIAAALGVSHATYYRRKAQDDYPNAEELRILARHFDLNPIDLMVRFGLVGADEAGELSGGNRERLATKRKAVKTSKSRTTSGRLSRVDLNGPSL